MKMCPAALTLLLLVPCVTTGAWPAPAEKIRLAVEGLGTTVRNVARLPGELRKLTNPRRLSERTDEWARPAPGGDYTGWEGQFDTLLADTCISFDNTFESGSKVQGRKPSENLFNSLRWHERLSDFETLVATEFDTLDTYLGSKGGWIAFIVIGVLLLLGVCVIYCTWASKFRTCCAEKCCTGCYYPEPRATHEDNIFRPKTTYWATGLFFFVLMTTFAILSAVKLAMWDRSVKATLCDGTMTLKGYFFGVESLGDLPPATISDWKGSQAQWNEMGQIMQKVTPGDANPIKQEIVRMYEDEVRPDLEGACLKYLDEITYYAGVVTEMQTMMNDAVATLDLGKDGQFPNGDPWPKTELTYTLHDLVQALLSFYATELNTTTYLGFDVIEANIEKYLGDDALLLEEGSAATLASVHALDDVNYAIAGLAGTMVTVNEDLAPAIDAMTAALAVWVAFSFVLLIFGTTAYALLFKSKADKKPPSPKLEPTFCALFVCVSLFGTISLILSGSLFLVANIGGDACNLVDTTLVQNGNWDVLPSHMWNATLHGTTDMRSVLNTCVKETGHGDVATTLTLTAGLDDLEETLEKTKAEIRLQALETLELDEKVKSTAQIQKALSETPYYIWANRDEGDKVYRTVDVADMGFVGGTRYAIPLVLDPDVPRPIRDFCFLPGLYGGVLAAFNKCREDMIVEAIDSKTLMELISARALAFADPSQPDVRTSWCMKSIETDPRNPFPCPADSVELDNTWPLEDALYNHPEVAATRDSIEIGASADEAAKWMAAVYRAVQFEHFRNYQIASGDARWPRLICPGGATTCTLPEMSEMIYSDLVNLGNELMQNVQHSADVIDDFVENVTIGNMEDLLNDGRDALANFNCQFVGTSLVNGLEVGLCEIAFPSASMLAMMGTIFFIACLGTGIITWLNWNHLYRMYRGGKYLRGYEPIARASGAQAAKLPSALFEDKTPATAVAAEKQQDSGPPQMI